MKRWDGTSSQVDTLVGNVEQSQFSAICSRHLSQIQKGKNGEMRTELPLQGAYAVSNVINR